VIVPNCCALIVTFHPPPDVRREIETIRPQCGRVIVIDNGSAAEELVLLEAVAKEANNVELVCNAENIGLASALNQGCRLAVERGFEWILFLDQDTQPLPNMVADLLTAWRCHPEPQRVGVIGSNHYDDRDQLTHRREANRLYSVAWFVITSGSMAPLRIFHDVGAFRDDLFIDAIDIEFGYRLKAHGFVSLLCLEPTMKHVWGSPQRIKVFGVQAPVTNHPPFRRYFIARNRIYVITRYWRRFPRRCAIDLARLCADSILLLLFENQKWQKAKALWTGFWHGLVGKLGPSAQIRSRQTM
jgi:rhamnosyltransferase